jgi:hypothetical protein
MYTLSLVLSLIGCGVADAEVAQPASAVPSQVQSELDIRELASSSPQGASQAMSIVRRDIEALSPQQRDQVASSMRTLSVNCSYTRASYQLPFVLQPRINALSPEHMEESAHPDLSILKQGINDHVAVLSSLGVDLPMPEQGDFLFGHPNLVDHSGAELLADPVQNMHAQLDNIRTDFPPDTQDIVSAQFELVESVTGHHSSFSSHLRGWLITLESIAPHVSDAQSKASVNEMVLLLDDYSNRGC